MSLEADWRARVREMDDQRTRAMYSQIGWMLIEAVLISAFIASFR